MSFRMMIYAETDYMQSRRIIRFFGIASIAYMAVAFSSVVQAADKIPVCMIIDDPAPFFNAATALYPGEVEETPTSFYLEFGQWAQANGVKGKFSVVPIAGGIAAVDGSLGEYPGHTAQERLEWIDTVKTHIEPRFTITPEIITHVLPWDIANSKTINNGQRENDYFAGLDIEAKTQYIAYAMQRLKNAGFSCGGTTMCWSIPENLNADFGKATLEAMRRVYGAKNVMFFNDSSADPEVVYRSADGYTATKTPPRVGDVDGVLYRSGTPTPERIEADASALISADGRTGAFVDQINRGKCLIFLTHIQSLYTNGRESGFEVYKIAVDRLNRFYGDDIEWMTADQVAQMIQIQTPPVYDNAALFAYRFPASSNDLSLSSLSDKGPNAHNAYAGRFTNTGLSPDVPAGMSGMSIDFTEAASESGSYRVIHTNDSQLLNTPDVAAHGGFVFDCWFKPTTADLNDGNGANRHKIFDYCGTEVLEIHQGKLLFRMNENAYQIYSEDLEADAWRHVTAVFDALGNSAVDDPNHPGFKMVDGKMSLYLDGVLISSIAAAKTGYGDAEDGEISIGRYAPKPGVGEVYGNYDGLAYNPQIWLGNKVCALPGDILGDANYDGVVDSGDAMLLAKYWLQSTGMSWCNGDFNSDGRVDDADAAIMAANWGKSLETASVPEPGVSPLVLVGLLYLYCRSKGDFHRCE